MARRIVKFSCFVLIFSVLLFGQSNANAPYLNPDLPAAERAADIVSRMTLDEKVLQMQNSRAGRSPGSTFPPTTGGTRRSTASPAPARPPSSRRRSAWRRPGTRDLMFRIADVIFDRGPRQVQPGHPAGQPPPLLRPDLLVAEHQHLPRSALGPRPGDLRRGSLPHRPAGGRLHQGHAGRRSPATTRPSPRPSTTPSTAVRSRSGTSSTSTPVTAISTRPTCQRSTPPSSTGKSVRLCAPTTRSTESPPAPTPSSSRRSSKTSGALTATSSATAAPSAISSAAINIGRPPPRPRRWPSRPAPTSPAVASIARSPRPSRTA